MIFSNNEALDGNNELMISNCWEENAGEGERRKGKTKEASARFPTISVTSCRYLLQSILI